MSEIVKLVIEWDIFEKEYKNVFIEDFCCYYLIKEREVKKKDGFFGGYMLFEINSILVKLIGRLFFIMVYYFKNFIK